MPNAFVNKNIAREAGMKSKRGKSLKTKQWELLGEKITNEYTERVFNYLDSIDDNGEFLKAYMNLLEYFKPKLNRTDIGNEDGSLNINITPLQFVKNDKNDPNK